MTDYVHGSSENPKPPPPIAPTRSKGVPATSMYTRTLGAINVVAPTAKPPPPEFWDGVRREAREEADPQMANTPAVPRTIVSRWRSGAEDTAPEPKASAPKRAAAPPPMRPPPQAPIQYDQKGKGGKQGGGAKGKGKGKGKSKYRGGPSGLSGDIRTFTEEERRQDYHDTRQYRGR